MEGGKEGRKIRRNKGREGPQNPLGTSLKERQLRMIFWEGRGLLDFLP